MLSLLSICKSLLSQVVVVEEEKEVEIKNSSYESVHHVINALHRSMQLEKGAVVSCPGTADVNELVANCGTAKNVRMVPVG